MEICRKATTKQTWLKDLSKGAIFMHKGVVYVVAEHEDTYTRTFTLEGEIGGQSLHCMTNVTHYPDAMLHLGAPERHS